MLIECDVLPGQGRCRATDTSPKKGHEACIVHGHGCVTFGTVQSGAERTERSKDGRFHGRAEQAEYGQASQCHGKNPFLSCFPGLPSSPSRRANHGTAIDGALPQYRGRPGQTQSRPKQLRAMVQFGLQAAWRNFAHEDSICLSRCLATRITKRLACQSEAQSIHD